MDLNKQNVNVEPAKKMWQAPGITSKVFAKNAQNSTNNGDDGNGVITGS